MVRKKQSPKDNSKPKEISIVNFSLGWLLRGWTISIIKASGFSYGVELGTFKGETTFFLLDNCPDLVLHTVDIFESQPDHPAYKDYSFEFSSIYPYVLHKSKSYGNRCVVHKGWTHEVVNEFEDRSLDFVIIDADHEYEAVKRDMLLWGPKVHKGGVLMGHDLQMEGVKRAVKECSFGPNIDDGFTCWAQVVRK